MNTPKRVEAISRKSPFVMLAPGNAVLPETFRHIACEPEAHSKVLSEMQVMRGAVALAEGAIRATDLDESMRYEMPGDDDSWHLLRMGDDGSIRGCARILVHPERTSFSNLRLSKSAIANSPDWKRQVRFAVEADMASARLSGLKLVEPGGWVLQENLRGGQDAVSIALSAFAWSQLMGGCLAYVTATVKHGSASILKRLGGSPLTHAGSQIPRYYDPQYGCEMELLKIDTKSLNPRFEPVMGPLREALALSTVLQGEAVPTALSERAA